MWLVNRRLESDPRKLEEHGAGAGHSLAVGVEHTNFSLGFVMPPIMDLISRWR